jgi:hypothetical protein
MPLHDWTNLSDWESVHQLWIVELFRWLKRHLPAGYRAGLGTVPALTIGSPSVHPDVNVRRGNRLPAGVPDAAEGAGPAGEAASWPPDAEVAVLTLDPSVVVQVTQQGRLIAVVELVSPRNKDRRQARLTAQNRYLGYLMHGVHLMLVDVHRQPLTFSFADALARALAIAQPPCPAPLAVSYRVGDTAAGGGRLLATWRRPLTVGAPLPALPLPLTLDLALLVDLEQTYTDATADAYLG